MLNIRRTACMTVLALATWITSGCDTGGVAENSGNSSPLEKVPSGERKKAKNPEASKKSKSPNPKNNERTSAANKNLKQETPDEANVPGDDGSLSKLAAVTIVESIIEDSVEFGPTLAVWVVDRSQSCRDLTTEVGRKFRTMCDRLSTTVGKHAGNGKDARLLSAVVAFGGQVDFVVDPPSDKPTDVSKALENIKADESGKEMTFTAVKSALEKYRTFRTDQQRELIVILVTDEAGDDQAHSDILTEIVRKLQVPIYVIGVPAPFGRETALAATVEAPIDFKPDGKWIPVLQGPETRHPERILLTPWGAAGTIDLFDSGFGQFGLERLCRVAGGRFLALRPSASEIGFAGVFVAEWPAANTPRFDPNIMRDYAPEYISEEEYQTRLKANKARMALFQAARLAELELLEVPKLEFEKKDEVSLTRELTSAQQVAAKLEPGVNRLYELLQEGESDREKLTGSRWQAAYDLAMGRASSAKARIDGYNAMLAALKRGKNFQSPTSNTWVLVPADTIEAGTALQKLVTKGTAYLERVRNEHAGTPWALQAERELKTPAGWKWTEK